MKKHYDAKKQEYHSILKILKKCYNYLYKIHFILKLNMNTLIAQLNHLVNDLSNTLIISWIAWIQFFNFTVKHVPGNRHITADDLSHRPKIKKEDEDEKNINDFINSQLDCIKISISKLEKQEDKILKSKYSFKY